MVERRLVIAGLATLPFGCRDNEPLRKPKQGRGRSPDTNAKLKAETGKTQQLGAAPAHDLVELVTLDPLIKLDIRYATPDNVTKRVLYSAARAFLIKDAAASLLKVSKQAQSMGVGLLVYDAYRPWRVTKVLWDATPRTQRTFVANPKEGSRHNRGSAIDLGLYDLKTGKPLPMPSAYDDFSARAHRDFSGGTADERRNRDLLAKLMESNGFVGRWDEWWHYDWKHWRRHPVLDLPFEVLSLKTSH